MKRLYLIGGPMGVGKTTVCRALQKSLDRSVFLDGDWCWDARPFQVTAETKIMVMENICFLLNNFLRCSAYDHVIFGWVLHQQAILDELRSRLTAGDAVIRSVSLVCTPEALTARVENDIRQGRREPGALAKSRAYLPLYGGLDTEKLDVSSCTPEEAARFLAGRA